MSCVLKKKYIVAAPFYSLRSIVWAEKNDGLNLKYLVAVKIKNYILKSFRVRFHPLCWLKKISIFLLPKSACIHKVGIVPIYGFFFFLNEKFFKHEDR